MEVKFTFDMTFFGEGERYDIQRIQILFINKNTEHTKTIFVYASVLILRFMERVRKGKKER